MSDTTENVEIPTVVAISSEDLAMIAHFNGKIKDSLQNLGVGYRRLEAMKAEADLVLKAEQVRLEELAKAVSDAETEFNLLTKATATKYQVDLNQKVVIDLNKGVFQIG